jgi:hypothetical protein
MTGSSQKTNEEAIIAVKEHIQNFPAFESHYTRSHNPGRKYLSPDLDIRKMFNLYVEKCEENNVSHFNERIYRNIFNEEFSSHFHHLHKGTCQKCDMLNPKIKASINNEEKTDLKQQHDIHLRNAELARNSLQDDKERASRNPDEYFAFAFNLQKKALSYPKLSVSIAYYKQNVYVFKFRFP